MRGVINISINIYKYLINLFIFVFFAYQFLMIILKKNFKKTIFIFYFVALQSINKRIQTLK